MSETESLLNDERLYAIKNNKKLIENLKRRPRQTLPEVKVGFFFIDKGADEIEYEPSLEHTSKTPDYRIILDGTEFFVEVKTVSLEELKIDKKPSGLKTLCWEFGKHDWNALYDALRRAKKGIVGPYIVFLEINVSEKITLSLRYFEEGRDSAKFFFVKDGGDESLQPKWIKTYKTLSRRDGKFAEISAVYVFSKDINNGDFVVSPSLPFEDKKFIEKILAPNYATKEFKADLLEKLRANSTPYLSKKAFYYAGLKAASILQKEREGKEPSKSDIEILSQLITTSLSFSGRITEEETIENIHDDRLRKFMKSLEEKRETLEKIDEEILKIFIFRLLKILLGDWISQFWIKSIEDIIKDNLKIIRPDIGSEICTEVSDDRVAPAIFSMLGLNLIKETVAVLATDLPRFVSLYKKKIKTRQQLYQMENNLTKKPVRVRGYQKVQGKRQRKSTKQKSTLFKGRYEHRRPPGF